MTELYLSPLTQNECLTSPTHAWFCSQMAGLSKVPIKALSKPQKALKLRKVALWTQEHLEFARYDNFCSFTRVVISNHINLSIELCLLMKVQAASKVCDPTVSILWSWLRACSDVELGVQLCISPFSRASLSLGWLRVQLFDAQFDSSQDLPRSVKGEVNNYVLNITS